MSGAVRAASLCALLSTAAGCAEPPRAALEARAPATASATSLAMAPSYRREVRPLLERYCLGCHSADGDAGEDHDFTRYEVLLAQRRALLAELEGGAMPPRDHPQPAPAERRRIADWARSGAPDN